MHCRVLIKREHERVRLKLSDRIRDQDQTGLVSFFRGHSFEKAGEGGTQSLMRKILSTHEKNAHICNIGTLFYVRIDDRKRGQ